MHEPAPEGRIEVITGCMFAGKTEELLRRLRRADIAGRDTAVFKPDIDDRYGTETIGTHDDQSRIAHVVEADSDLADLREMAEGASVVAIDEGNFFNESLVATVRELADSGSRVIVTGLDQTYRGEPFEPMNDLLAIADDVSKLSAICTVCGCQATRTQRLIDGEPASADGPTVQVGGDESYEARCRNCYELA